MIYFLQFVLQEKILQANMKSEERVEERRYLKRLQQEKTEQELEDGIRKVTIKQMIRNCGDNSFSLSFLSFYDCAFCCSLKNVKI